MVMERLVGHDLSEILRSLHSLPISVACCITSDIANALGALQDQGIVHRDVKPSNIFITSLGEVKLIDLGIARQSTKDESDLTGTDEIVGTFDYMAPEQALESSSVDFRSDIYGLGCTFYHMLGGSPPFMSHSSRNLLRKALAHAIHPLPNLRDLRADVPDELSDFVCKMCAKAPSDRVQDFAAIRTFLKRFGDSSQVVRFAGSLTALSTRPEIDLARSVQPSGSPHRSPLRRLGIGIASSLALLAVAWMALGAYPLGARRDHGMASGPQLQVDPIDSAADGVSPHFEFHRHLVTDRFVRPRQAVPVDIDRDGDIDLAFGSNEKIGWLENDGKQNFLFRMINQPYIITAIEPIDFDGDGDIDLVATAWGKEDPVNSESSLVVYRQEKPTFDWRIVSDQLRGAMHLALSDLDGDSDLDLLVASNKDGSFRSYSHLQEYQFHERRLAEGIGPRAIAVADLDGDGSKDAILTSDGDHQVQVVYGPILVDTPRTEVVAKIESAQGLTVADLDRDGDQDIIVGSGTRSTLQVIENLGNRSWKVRELCHANQGASHLTAVDFDSDGDLDVLAASSHRSSVILYLQEADRFLPTLVSGNAIQVFSCYASDLDQDGDMDVCASSTGENSVVWFENRGALALRKPKPK